jgi:uncharacterized membrane protein
MQVQSPNVVLSESSRIFSIDILRGLIMVVMALDHVRDFYSNTPFSPLDLSQTSPLLFFTRWITHLCAPNFVFLSGISIFLYQQKVNSKPTTSVFLLTRGVWLVAVELLVISFLIVWNYNMLLFEVIWVIGLSMICLAALIWLPRIWLTILSLLVIVLHQLIPDPQIDSTNVIRGMFHHTPFFVPGTPQLLVAYTLIPWLAVMSLGYSIGHWFTHPPDKQKQTLLIAGMSALALFVILRVINYYGDPVPWQVQDRGATFTLLSFLNVSKSPPSLLFLLVTIGIGLTILSQLTRVKGLSFFRVYGSVPFFYFVIHFVLIVVGAALWTTLYYGETVNLAMADQSQYPAEYHPNLLRAYLVWITLVLLLYFPCKWFGAYRKKHPEKKWLSYL